ncbi:MAG: hypothetical protein AMXMBFR47_33630 [Planctomycetota bacterium]
MSARFVILGVAVASTVAPARADLAVSVDIYEYIGEVPPPPGLLAIDMFVDPAPDDVWTVGGLYGRVTPWGQAAGVGIRYAPHDDPNTPFPEHLLNPGRSNRYTTFVTKPRNRDASRRFDDAGAAIAGGYVHAAQATANRHEIDVAWFADPPEGPDSPSVDGFVARITIDARSLFDGDPNFFFELGSPQSATGPIIFESVLPGSAFGTVSASYDNPTLTGLDWAVWYIPEPAPIAIFLIAAVALRSR